MTKGFGRKLARKILDCLIRYSLVSRDYNQLWAITHQKNNFKFLCDFILFFFMLNKRYSVYFAVFTTRVVLTSPLCRFRKQLDELEEAHMLRGQLKASQQHALLSSHDDLAQALEGAFFVQVKGDISHTNVSVFLKSETGTIMSIWIKIKIISILQWFSWARCFGIAMTQCIQEGAQYC